MLVILVSMWASTILGHTFLSDIYRILFIIVDFISVENEVLRVRKRTRKDLHLFVMGIIFWNIAKLWKYVQEKSRLVKEQFLDLYGELLYLRDI